MWLKCLVAFQGREITMELLNYRKSGEAFWNLLSMTPVLDSGGRLMSFLGVQSDITELVRRKEAEKELQDAKVSLFELFWCLGVDLCGCER